MDQVQLSIIIPTLNEANYLSRTIEKTLNKAQEIDKLEIIIVDAGSSDGTLDTAGDFQLKSFSKPAFASKKYLSLNFGMENARGEVVLFLDADTTLPERFDAHIYEKLKDPMVVGGAFELTFENPDWKLLAIQWFNQLRYRLGQMYYGDQAVFCRRATALRVGGVPEKQLMESAFFCRKLKEEGMPSLIRQPVRTSPRRFIEHGFFKVSWFDLTMWIRFMLNLSVEEYGKKYWRFNLESNG